MNRSFSKIRHIQESNMRLEKRFLMEQDSTSASTGEFVYSEDPNSTTAGQSNDSRYQQEYLGLNNSLDTIVGKQAILFKTATDFSRQTEIAKFVVNGYDIKPAEQKGGVGSVYLFSDNASGTKKPFMRISDVPNVQTIKYYKDFSDQATEGFNDTLKQWVLSRAFPNRYQENKLYPPQQPKKMD